MSLEPLQGRAPAKTTFHESPASSARAASSTCRSPHKLLGIKETEWKKYVSGKRY
jgi:hypothetical protein